MSILERDALLESTSAKVAAPRGSASPMSSSTTRPSSGFGDGRGVWGPRGGGRTGAAHESPPKRLDQEMGFLSVGTYFTVSVQPALHTYLHYFRDKGVGLPSVSG